MYNDKKSFTRNETVTFTASFFEDDAGTVPVVPISQAYPSFVIRNPSSTLIYSGVAISSGSEGNYKVNWTIPSDAMLSSDNDAWTIEWIMVSSDNRQLSYKENFMVVDLSIETEEDHSIIQLVPENKSFRISNFFEMQPIEINIDIYLATDTDNVYASYSMADLKGPVSDRGHLGYYMDIQGLSAGDYLIIWSYRYSEISDVSREYKTIRSVKPKLLKYSDQLRILIDRFNKRQSAPNSYSDSDLIEFLNQGLAMVNNWYPVCQPYITWNTLDSSPYPIYVIAAAAVYGLKSQYLLENDLAFNFSGQTTTLDYDRTGNIDAAYNSLIEWINNNLSKTKVAVTRSAGIGSVAIRPLTRYNSMHNRVIQYEGYKSGVGNNVWGLMVILGL